MTLVGLTPKAAFEGEGVGLTCSEGRGRDQVWAGVPTNQTASILVASDVSTRNASW